MRVLLSATYLILLGCLLVGTVLADPSDNLEPVTVKIHGAICAGSGSIVSTESLKTYLLTNDHVCQCAQYKHSVWAVRDDGTIVKGPIVKRNAVYDLCAVRVENQAQTLVLGLDAPKGTKVYTRGYPGGDLAKSSGYMGTMTEWDYTSSIEDIGECPTGSKPQRDPSGILRGCMLHHHTRLSSLYARPGASGSPVVDSDGYLVGVIASWQEDNDFDAGLVPYSELKKFLQGL